MNTVKFIVSIVAVSVVVLAIISPWLGDILEALWTMRMECAPVCLLAVVVLLSSVLLSVGE
jgi:type III secretory pathway component EscS